MKFKPQHSKGSLNSKNKLKILQNKVKTHVFCTKSWELWQGDEVACPIVAGHTLSLNGKAILVL